MKAKSIAQGLLARAAKEIPSQHRKAAGTARSIPFATCKGCGSTDAPRPKASESSLQWSKRTGWDYLDSRSDRLCCPTCLGDLQKRNEARAKTP